MYSFAQAAAAAQAGASVIQIFVGRLRVIVLPLYNINQNIVLLILLTFLMYLTTFQDWARNHSGDPEIEAALKRGEDPGLALVS